MAEPLILRPADPEDCGTIERLINDSYEIYVEAIGRKPAPMTADYRELAQRGRLSCIDLPDGTLAGVLVDYPLDNSWFLETVAVDPGLQGHGYGRQIVAMVEERGRSAGYSRIRLYTNVKMTGNLVFYPKLGYRETGRVTENGFERVYFEKEIA